MAFCNEDIISCDNNIITFDERLKVNTWFVHLADNINMETRSKAGPMETMHEGRHSHMLFLSLTYAAQHANTSPVIKDPVNYR